MKLYERIKEKQVYVIAEMSANHGGDINNAYRIIEEAARAGADCVKIQTYTADTLTIDCRREEYMIKGGLWDGYNYYDLYKEAFTPWEWQADLMEKCKEVGVDFLSTPFDNSAVDFLENMGVEFYKIASFEAVDIPLIEYTASKRKPMIISVGMASVEEIEELLEACKRQGNEQVILLKCCSQYPAQFKEMKLSLIPDMVKRFQVPVGLSDHSMGALAPVIAVSMGACVIEKHVRLDEDVESADAAFSMTMSEFGDMVQKLRDTTTIMGCPDYTLTEHERKSRESRRSLVAVKKIQEGEVFTSENIRSVRPAIGLAPKYYGGLLGKRAKKSYDFGEPLQESEIG